MTNENRKNKTKSKHAGKEPFISSLVAKDQSGGKLFSKVSFVALVVGGIFIGSILYHRQGNAYISQLNTALAKITKVSEGKVAVSTTQSGIDAEVETMFTAVPGKPQETLTRLDYLQSADDSADDVKLLDMFRAPYAQLPIADSNLWVTVKTEDDIDSLESLGFPVGTLMNENANTPLLPFGNFTKAESMYINQAVRKAFKNAEFIRVQDGLMEFQANISKANALAIVSATSETAEPMDEATIDKLYQNSDNVAVTAKIDRDNDRLIELKLVTDIDDEELTAVYIFDYENVNLPVKPPKSITAEKFVTRYLRSIRQND